MKVKDFEAFYIEHKQNVFGYLIAGLRDQDLAGDILQDVFLKMLEKVKAGVIRQATARNYLYSIARNAMIDAIKKRSRTGELENPEQISFESISDESDRIRVLFVDALAELPYATASLLEMRLLNQMPVEEICARLDISRATLYRKLEQGLQSVANYFRKAGYDPEVLEA